MTAKGRVFCLNPALPASRPATALIYGSTDESLQDVDTTLLLREQCIKAGLDRIEWTCDDIGMRR